MKYRSFLPKLIALFFVVGVLVALSFVVFKKKCEKISKMEKIRVTYQCMNDVIFLDIQAKACIRLGRDSQCQLSFHNLKEFSILEDEFKKDVNDCVTNFAKKKNYCTFDS